MVEILFWISIISGGILVLLLLLSIMGGMELDIDVDFGDGDADTSSGGIGVVKGVLTFISVSTWMIRVMMIGNQQKWIAIVIGLICGLIAYFILSYILRLLLRNESNVNWSINDALFQKGKVYLKIPAQGEGIVYIDVKGVKREFKARSNDSKDIITGASVTVLDIQDEYVIVESTEKAEL